MRWPAWSASRDSAKRLLPERAPPNTRVTVDLLPAGGRCDPIGFPPSEEVVPGCGDRAGFLATGRRPPPPSQPSRASDLSPQNGAGGDLTVHSCGGSAGLAHSGAPPASLHSIAGTLADARIFC